ncbi:MAG: hypothetical protein LGB06_08360, partial [Sulfurovum sp.]|nr:hypothetical protein [Sulfurovum sp.]
GRHVDFVLNNWSKLRIYEDFTFRKILLLMEINSQRKSKKIYRTLSSKIKVTLYNYWSFSSN